MEDYFLKPGFLFTSSEQTIIRTVLGSCVSLCLWDRVNRFGGMNHFIYPMRKDGERSTVFGDVSCRHLLRLMSNMGSKPENLAVHIVGGAQNPTLKSNIGKENIAIANTILLKHGLSAASQDVGGEFGRKVAFNTATGEVLVYKCERLREGDWHKPD